MLGQICACCNPDCIERGCLITRMNRKNYQSPIIDSKTVEIKPLTEDVRRIMQEELQKYNKKNS